MPGNPVKKRPQSDLVNQIPSDWSPELQKAYDKALKDYKAQMPAGDILDYVRTPFNVMGNSMAGLGAEMIGKGKQFEAKYGWMPKTRAEMDAVEAMMGAMGPVIDTMDYLKVPPIVGPNTPTIAAAMQGVDRAAARLTAEQAAKAAKNAGQAVKKAATSDDMAYAIENLLKKTGHGPMEIMIGPNARTYRHDDAALAAQMEKEGKSRSDIWQATRTVRAPDNQLKQELSDLNMKYSVSPVRSRQYETDRKRYSQAIDKATTDEELQAAQKYYEKQRRNNSLNFTGKAQEFIEHPELFAAYPELANYAFRELEPTHKKFTAPQTAYGFFSPGQQTVTVSTDAPFKRSTALHELQHAIQEIEGWQGGSSPEEMAARLAERDIAKTREIDLKQSIEDMARLLPPSQDNLIETPRLRLKNIQDFLDKTKQLEGETDPYDAYRKVSGEEEARMVQARRDYPEEKLAQRPPFMDYEAKPWEHITEYASGGEVHMGSGGFLEMIAKAAKEGVSRTQRLAMTNKDVAKRIPALEEAIAALERGEITKQQYAQLVQAYKPVVPFQEFFKPETDEKIIGALTKTNREKEGTRPKQSYFGVPSSTLKRGDKAATRQDIPSYTEADTWVVTAHQPQQGKRVYAGAGPRIGYEPVAMLNDVRFEVQPNAAMKIAKGGQKGTIATMEGYWEPITRELAEEMGPELMRDPRWVQAGMDPTRSASFYNRETMQPIVEGEQVLHSGPLVLVKNPVYGDIEDFPFKEGGEVRAAKGGILGALARTAEKGVERAVKAVPVAQRAIVGAQEILPTAEREANLAKLLEESKIKNRMYHGTRGKQNVSNPGEEGIREFKNSARQMTFASPNTDFANNYAGRLDPEGMRSPTMYPVYIQAKNPWDYENPEHIEQILPYLPQNNKDKWSVLVKKPEDIKELLEAGNWGLIENPKVIEAIQKAGFDAAHMQENGVKNIGVFDPKRIKSALGNRGTYDINDPDINKASGGAVMMSNGGILGAIAKTAKAGVERAAKAEKAIRPSKEVAQAAAKAVKDAEQLAAAPVVQTVANPERMQFPGIYKRPDVIAAEAAARVAPESPNLQRLFGVTREDLYQMGKGRKGNLPGTLPGLAANPKGSKVGAQITTPQNTQRLIDVMTEAEKHPALVRGMDPWYVMDPLFQRMSRELGPERAATEYNLMNNLFGMSSPGSEVMTEIPRGSAAYYLHKQGRFPEFEQYAGMPAHLRGEDFPQDIRTVPGHAYHSTAQAGPMRKFLEKGELDMSSPKVPMYIQASGVPETGFQTATPVGDAHWSRAVGLADVRGGSPANWKKSVSNTEMYDLGPWWREQVAAPLGLESVPAQARAWGAFSPQTGVTTPIGAPKLELIADQTAMAADRLGISPEDALIMFINAKARLGKKEGGAVESDVDGFLDYMNKAQY